MPGVHIVTDSACDLTDQLVKEHSVIVVPLSIRFGDEELEDRRQLTPAEFWERCRGKGDLPSTAAPSPGAFQAAFQQAVDIDVQFEFVQLCRKVGHIPNQIVVGILETRNRVIGQFVDDFIRARSCFIIQVV